MPEVSKQLVAPGAASMAPVLPPGVEMRTAQKLCDHCEGVLLNNKAYRVRSEDGGLTLLDMIVCYACHLEAQKLDLETEEIRESPERPRHNF